MESSLSSSPQSSSASFTSASSSMSQPSSSSSSSTTMEEWSFTWKASSMYIVHPDSQLLYSSSSSSSERPWFLGDSMALSNTKKKNKNIYEEKPEPIRSLI